MTTRQDGFDDLALAAITDGATPLVRAAVRRVWDLAAEFDIEDGYTIEPFAKRPVSRGDRIRREIATALLGLDDDAHPLIQPHDACQARGCEECEFTGCADAVRTTTIPDRQ